MISQRLRQTTALLLAVLVLSTGCHPTQPFYFQNDGDLSHYLDTATQIEYPDVEHETLSEASEAAEPFHLRNLEFAEFWDLTLQEAVAIALHNSEVIRSAAQFQQFGFSSTGASRIPGAPTVYDPAISETLTNPNGLQVDGSGNRIVARGATRAATVGGYADALAEFDAQVFSNFSYSTTDRPQNVGDTNPFQSTQAHNSNFLLALSKRTVTGGVWTARHTIGYSENNVMIGTGRAVPSDYTAAVEFEMTHPLLANAGPQVNRLPILLARIRTDVSQTTFETAVRNLVMDIERTYWDLHCAYRIVEANKQGRDAALTAWRKDRSRAGKKDPGAQEPRSNGQYLRFRARYEASLAANTQGEGLLVLERRLRGLMGIAATEQKIIRPVDEPTAGFVTFDWGEIKLESLIRAPELRQQKWSVKQAELEFVSARNQLLPDVNLGMRYRIVGIGDELINADRRGLNFTDTPVGSVAFDELTEGNFTEALVTLSVQPNAIGARREHARVQNATLEIKRAKAQLRAMENNLVHDLSNAHADLQNQYTLAQIAYSQWLAARDEVRKLEVRLDVDERLHDQLLDAFDRRAAARIEYYQRLCDYNKAISNVHFVKGSLLEYNGISLAEGPWPKKAYWDALGRARERDASYYFNYGSTRPKVISRGPVEQGYHGHVLPGQAVGQPSYEMAPGQPVEDGMIYEEIEGEMIEGEMIEGAPAPIIDAAPGSSRAPTPAAPRMGRAPEGSSLELNSPVQAGRTSRGSVQPASHQQRTPSFSWGPLGL